MNIIWLTSLITLSIVRLSYFCLSATLVLVGVVSLFLIINDITHFLIFIDHLDFLLIEVIVQVLCLIFFWVSSFILIVFSDVFIYSGATTLLGICDTHTFSFFSLSLRCQSFIKWLIFSLHKQFFHNTRWWYFLMWSS